MLPGTTQYSAKPCAISLSQTSTLEHTTSVRWATVLKYCDAAHHKCKSIAAGTDIPPIFLFVVKAAAAAVSHAWERRFAATTISGSLLQQRVLALLLQAMILVYVQFCVLHSIRCRKFLSSTEKKFSEIFSFRLFSCLPLCTGLGVAASQRGNRVDSASEPTWPHSALEPSRENKDQPFCEVNYQVGQSFLGPLSD